MMPFRATTTMRPFSRLMALDPAEPRQVRSRTDLEQHAVAALDHGAAGVEVAQPPAFGDRQPCFLLVRIIEPVTSGSSSADGDVAAGAAARRAPRIAAAAAFPGGRRVSVSFASFVGGLGLRLLGAVEALGELASCVVALRCDVLSPALSAAISLSSWATVSCSARVSVAAIGGCGGPHAGAPRSPPAPATTPMAAASAMPAASGA